MGRLKESARSGGVGGWEVMRSEAGSGRPSAA